MFKFFKYLFHGPSALNDTSKDAFDKAPLELTETVEIKPTKEKKTKNKKSENKEGFVDPETGKVYKSERALKGAQTRRKNATKTKSKSKK